MTQTQCNELVRRTATVLGISALVTPVFCSDVYRESEGHPYVAKILVGEAADGKSVRRIERIVAGRDDLLDALFERTYRLLSPAAKRVFLTVSNWRSLVPQAALDAALLRTRQAERIDTVASIDELRRVSFIDEHTSSKDDSVFVSVPLIASVFGERKLSTSRDQAEIDEDTRFLHRFGPMQLPDVKLGIEPRIKRFLGSLSEELANGKISLSDQMPVLELIARHYPPTWLMIADLWSETNDEGAPSQRIDALTRYLEATTPGAHQQVGWERIAVIYRQKGEWTGFVNAQVQIAELPGADLAKISASVNTFNSVSQNLDSSSRRGFAERLARVMEPKIAGGDSTDCSRLAWLLIHCEREDRALEIVELGLSVDLHSEHCQRLKCRIWMRRADGSRQAEDLPGLLEATLRLTETEMSDFGSLSDAANFFNQSPRDIEPDRDRRLVLAFRLARAMEARIDVGDATDCSRLGWVWVNAGEIERARAVVARGLRLDPENDHCQKLKARIG